MKSRFLCTLILLVLGFSLRLGAAEGHSAMLIKVAQLIEERYVFAEKGQEIASELRAKVLAGEFSAISDPAVLAKEVTSSLRMLSQDGHLYLQHLPKVNADEMKPSIDWQQQERVEEKQTNFGFTEFRAYANGAGYLRIATWAHPNRGIRTAESAMKLLEQSDHIIIDLRGNGGGYGGLMQHILKHIEQRHR